MHRFIDSFISLVLVAIIILKCEFKCCAFVCKMYCDIVYTVSVLEEQGQE